MDIGKTFARLLQEKDAIIQITCPSQVPVSIIVLGFDR